MDQSIDHRYPALRFSSDAGGDHLIVGFDTELLDKRVRGKLAATARQSALFEDHGVPYTSSSSVIYVPLR